MGYSDQGGAARSRQPHIGRAAGSIGLAGSAQRRFDGNVRGGARRTTYSRRPGKGYPPLMARSEPEWRQYERWVASLIKARAPEAEVAHDVRVLGRAGF